jgi:AraC family transcriptional regulator
MHELRYPVGMVRQLMNIAINGERTVEAQMPIGMGEVALVRERFMEPIDVVGAASETHHLQLSLLPSPRPIMACYPERWNARRFERMGNVFLLPAQSTLHARSECRMQQSLVCNLVPGEVEQWFGEEVEWPEHLLVGTLDITMGEVKRLLFRIARELQDPGFGSDALVELLTGQVCIELARQLRALDQKAPGCGLAAWRLRLIDEQVIDAPGKVTLAGLADSCGLSVRHLARAYRASRGRTLGDLIAEHRINLARAMLSQGATVKQTAFAVGFSAPTNFASAFRRATGETPRQYRSQHKTIAN